MMAVTSCATWPEPNMRCESCRLQSVGYSYETFALLPILHTTFQNHLRIPGSIIKFASNTERLVMADLCKFGNTT